MASKAFQTADPLQAKMVASCNGFGTVKKSCPQRSKRLHGQMMLDVHRCAMPKEGPTGLYNK